MTAFESFHFLRPAWLLALPLLVPALWLALRQQASASAWRRACDPQLLRHLVLPGGARGSRGPLAALAAGWIAACLALAGPSWERLPQPAWDEPVQTVFVLSLAASMNGSDVAPSRAVRARYALLDALERADGAVGLVIFAEEPYAVTPLTDDPRVIAQQVSLLEPGLMPGHGSRVDRALEEARVLIERAGAPRGRVLLLGDGLGDAPDAAMAAAARSAAAGSPVSVLGIAGDLEALEALADAGGGRFAALRADDADIAYLLASDLELSPLAGGSQRSDLTADVWRDAGAWLVLVPLLLASLAFRRGWALAACLLAFLALDPAPASAELDDWWARPDQQGARAFERGDHAEAAELFQDPAWRGVSQYKSGDYEQAIETLSARDDSRSQYNLGNALARAQRLEDAIAAYERALEQDPAHEDALFNRDLLQKLLEEQQRLQEQQQDQSGQQQEQPDQGQEQEQDQEQSQQGQEHEEQQEQSQQGQEQEQQQDQSQQQPSQQQPQEQQQEQQQLSQQQQQPSPDREQQDPSERESASNSQEGREAEASPAPAAAPEFSESDQEVEQWLNRVPDDPAGLLREKLRRRYAERRYGSQGGWR